MFCQYSRHRHILRATLSAMLANLDIEMNGSFSQMDLSLLADYCADELKRRRQRMDFDERYCLEIFRRATLLHSEQAWETLQERFHEAVRIWLHSHSYADVALRRDSEQNYISHTFARFWLATHDQHLEFTSLRAALSYLHATLSGLLTDALRAHLRARDLEIVSLVPDIAEEPVSEDPTDEASIDQQALWKTICSLLPEERERRLVYLLYYCGLKPRNIVVHCAQEFGDVQEIYRMSHNILVRLRRNRDRLRPLLGDEEVS